MRVEGSRALRRRILPGPCTQAGGIEPKVSVSSFMGYLKRKSSQMIYEQFGNLKYKYKGRKP